MIRMGLYVVEKQESTRILKPPGNLRDLYQLTDVENRASLICYLILLSTIIQALERFCHT
jgi:hypothetical protein